MRKNTFFFKVSLVFLILIVGLGALYIYLTVSSSARYYEEANQQLNSNIAEHTVQEVSPLVNGDVDTNAIQEIMHSMMVINPSVEVYLLDTEGNIITYVAPYKEVKLERISLAPIHAFLEDPKGQVVRGDDPRNPGQSKVFSAARIEENERTTGYVYIILASQEQVSVLSRIRASYVLQLAARTFLISLLVALILGILAFRYLTRNLKNVMIAVRRFKEGDLNARAAGKGDFEELSHNFNQMADQIKSNIDQIRSVERLRTELIGNVSHDLRTPLSIVHGYVETLKMKKDLTLQERERYLDVVHKGVDSLSRLIDQLFEYSKLEAQEIKPHKEPFDLKDLVHDIIMKFDLAAKDKEIKMEIQTPAEPSIVFADLALVERAVSNLLDNSLKFGKPGGHVKLQIAGRDMDNYEVKISDDGPGIPDSEQSYIFERYRRFDRTKSSKGAGLGLAIVKKILEIHDQSISVISQVGIGTTFSFNLPAYRP